MNSRAFSEDYSQNYVICLTLALCIALCTSEPITVPPAVLLHLVGMMLVGDRAAGTILHSFQQFACQHLGIYTPCIYDVGSDAKQ